MSTLKNNMLISHGLIDIQHKLKCASIFFYTQHTPLSYDYVLVAKTMGNQEREIYKRQTEYIEELKKKNLKVTVSV